MKKRALLALGLVLSFNSYAQQTGTCTAGTQYCESLDTTNDTLRLTTPTRTLIQTLILTLIQM
jgi:hypothetical protein